MQLVQFFAKRPPKPPPFFFCGIATVFLPRPLVVPPLFSSTFLRIGSVSSSWSSFCIPPKIQSRMLFSSLAPPAPLAAVAANTVVVAGANDIIREAISTKVTEKNKICVCRERLKKIW
uniref:Uncharacterized protein n=1 Tax=Lotus japonicus TaxID=34305 RepID=I3S741_LOTJA|nr:unknown [Lotus japonicus]